MSCLNDVMLPSSDQTRCQHFINGSDRLFLFCFSVHSSSRRLISSPICIDIYLLEKKKKKRKKTLEINETFLGLKNKQTGEILFMNTSQCVLSSRGRWQWGDFSKLENAES